MKRACSCTRPPRLRACVAVHISPDSLPSASSRRSLSTRRLPMSSSASERTDAPRALDPDRLSGYIDPLYRAAWALCGSRHDAEDLVQDTFAQVLKRPRRLRDANELGYLLRALQNTYFNDLRKLSRRPATRQLFEDDAPHQYQSRVSAREIME